MAKINLLPWRAERRKQREREFYMMLGMAAAAAVAAFLVAMLWMSHLIDDQNSRNAYLQKEIKELDAKIEEIKELDKRRSQLLQRKEIIERLQANRSQMVHLFDDLVKTIPNGARLSTLKQAGDVLTLDGVAESNSRVATYMRNIDASQWLGHSDLRKIENQSGNKEADPKLPFAFSLEVKLPKPGGDKEGEEGAEGTSAADAPVAATKPGLGQQVGGAMKQLATSPPATQSPPAPAAQPPAAATGGKP